MSAAAFSNSPCVRFSADGSKCGNSTSNADGWCRAPGCDGFRTAELAEKKPGVHRRVTPSRKRTVPADEAGFTAGDADNVVVSGHAIDTFVASHGGSRAHAKAELRDMMRDFAEHGRVMQDRTWWLLVIDGFVLVLTPDRAAISSYRTAHVDRSYAQIAARIPSRVSVYKPSRTRRLPPEMRPDTEPDQDARQAAWDEAAEWA